MAIIISVNGGDALKVEESGVSDEAYLEAYVSSNPNSLPFDDPKPNRPLFAITRQFRPWSGPIDVLAMDQDGDLYIIETKLFKNADKREVIPQMLDYGASIWTGYGDGEAVVRALSQALADGGRGNLQQHLARAYSLTDEDTLPIIDALKRNMLDGSIRISACGGNSRACTD